ncbi:MAG: alpha-L-fucosidase [Verrucomicrobiae bacterium]|nr:alpha-L-fucosidase [Verrucomicrobiae bacterium]
MPKTDAAGRGVWFRQSRFALFIHWGLYSPLAGVWKGKVYHGIGEWIQCMARIPAAEYATLAGQWNPVDFDAREWARVAREAGMRYIVLTTKHHDGFALFKSQVSPFNMVEATPFGRDIVAELAEACRAEGLGLGFYYSQTQDWHEPDAEGNHWDAWTGPKDFNRYLQNKALPQIRELLTNYGPVALIWFDTPGPISAEASKSLEEMIRALQPGCLINSRIGNGRGDYETLGDSEIPHQPVEGLWETIDTHNDSWGFVTHDLNWKTPGELAVSLVRVVSRGGNYMINVGPEGSGKLPEASVRALRQVGEWLKGAGPSVYGAGPSGLPGVPWGESTRSGDRIFLHVLDWPRDGRLVLPGVRASQPVQARRLGGDRSSLTVTPCQGGLAVALPLGRPEELIPVIEIENGSGLEISPGLYLLKGWENALEAYQAVGSGFVLGKASWMEKMGEWKHRECLEKWTTGGQARWEVSLVEPGWFRLELEYACCLESDQSEWRMTWGGASLLFPMIASGNVDSRPHGGPLIRFRSLCLGVVGFETAGPQVLTLGLEAGEGGGVRIGGLRLVPVRM